MIFLGAGAYSVGLIVAGVLVSSSWVLAALFPKGGVSAIRTPSDGWVLTPRSWVSRSGQPQSSSPFC